MSNDFLLTTTLPIECTLDADSADCLTTEAMLQQWQKHYITKMYMEAEKEQLKNTLFLK